MKKLQIDRPSTRQVRIDTGWADLLARMRADSHVSMKSLIEDALEQCYRIDDSGKPCRVEQEK